jgi:hypothetical protein
MIAVNDTISKLL